VGFFSKVLSDSGLDVRGFDGRDENIHEARQRYPDIPFDQGDVEDSSIMRLGSFDLVLCFGLLYHLESPLRAIRHLRHLTRKVLLLESMCFPDTDPFISLREEPLSVDQSLSNLAFYPSEGCIVKMCYQSGFSNVLRVQPLPDHEQFRETEQHWRRRTVLVAVRGAFKSPGFELLTEPQEITDPWEKIPANSPKLKHRVRRFLAKPMRQKLASIAHKFQLQRNGEPVTVRLPFGVRWLIRNDHISQSIRQGRFENKERAFVERFLQRGMMVLDIGAHHGFYTLLASQCVGAEGRVISFEPSQRERDALLQHVRLNRCENVAVQELALGNEEKETSLYVAEELTTGCNSLRPPIVLGGTSPMRVEVMRLDNWLQKQKISHVDFIKLDVEGGELDVLKGAHELLERRPRPVILTEVQDIRTEPWGYPAKEIIEHMSQKGFKWFEIEKDGNVIVFEAGASRLDGNFVACPEEREQELLHLAGPSDFTMNGPSKA
jgi:FkbM family methyltransferase